MQIPKYYSKYTTATRPKKKPRDEDKPGGSSLAFATQEKPTQDDDKLPSLSSSCVMQEKKKLKMIIRHIHCCLLP
jgi:hypothetical protein